MDTVDKKTNLSLKEFNNEYYRHCKPVVISDATQQWKAHSGWNAGFFKDKFAERNVEVGGKPYLMKDFMDIVLHKANLDLMRAIKKAFDPNNILNRGKIFNL